MHSFRCCPLVRTTVHAIQSAAVQAAHLLWLCAAPRSQHRQLQHILLPCLQLDVAMRLVAGCDLHVCSRRMWGQQGTGQASGI